MYISRDLHNELCRLFVSSFSLFLSSSVVRPCFSSCRSVCSLETRRLAVCGGWNKHQRKVDDKKMRRKTFSSTFSSLLNGKLFDSCYFLSTPNFRSRFICARCSVVHLEIYLPDLRLRCLKKKKQAAAVGRVM